MTIKVEYTKYFWKKEKTNKRPNNSNSNDQYETEQEKDMQKKCIDWNSSVAAQMCDINKRADLRG